LTTRTGRIVAAKPKTEGTERSTNSPTAIVQSRAIAKKTSACCEPKMAWKVDPVKKTPGSAAA
jgi:hypothetical protein